jgi:hypothetical protein
MVEIGVGRLLVADVVQRAHEEGTSFVGVIALTPTATHRHGSDALRG